MSADYPDYEYLRERSVWLARLWIVGDLGYYAGLVGAALGFSAVVATPTVYGIAWLMGDEDRVAEYWTYFWIGLYGLPCGVLLTVVSAALKRLACRRCGLSLTQDLPSESTRPPSDL